jgi:DNA polymerase elongation subunit (family B)
VNSNDGSADADGVLVISVWTDGAGSDFLARVTMSRAIAEPQVRVVASAEETLAIVSEWLDELCE